MKTLSSYTTEELIELQGQALEQEDYDTAQAIENHFNRQ